MDAEEWIYTAGNHAFWVSFVHVRNISTMVKTSFI